MFFPLRMNWSCSETFWLLKDDFLQYLVVSARDNHGDGNSFYAVTSKTMAAQEAQYGSPVFFVTLNCTYTCGTCFSWLVVSKRCVFISVFGSIPGRSQQNTGWSRHVRRRSLTSDLVSFNAALAALRNASCWEKVERRRFHFDCRRLEGEEGEGWSAWGLTLIIWYMTTHHDDVFHMKRYYIL